ncbi:MAG: hypothetical protein GXP05_04435 [Alphaproteobacteria bacterium]|nr:hypothetical protein [Alphaproteobacteria bacterium]
MKTILPSDRTAIIGVIDPDANAAGTLTTAWIDMSIFNAVMAIVMAGTLGAAATLDAKFQQATDSAGTGVKDITGKAITQLTQAGVDSDKQAIINLFAEELDVTNNFTHVRLSMTTAVAASDSGALVLGSLERYGPASANDLASVDEIV